MRIVASSPGDIVVEFKITATMDNGETGLKTIVVPVKSLSASKSMDNSAEYGVGSHQAYAHVIGKIAYEGDFDVGTWYVDDENNPNTWEALLELLTYQDDEGLPREFTINIHARSGEGMSRAGTGTYGNKGDTGAYTGSTLEDSIGAGTINYAQLNNNVGSSGAGSSDMIITSYHRCTLKSDSMSIGEVGSTVGKKYGFNCLYRDPR